MLTLYSTPNNVKNRGFVCVIVNVLSVVNPDNGCTVFSPVKNSIPVPKLKLSKFLNGTSSVSTFILCVLFKIKLTSVILFRKPCTFPFGSLVSTGSVTIVGVYGIPTSTYSVGALSIVIPPELTVV